MLNLFTPYCLAITQRAIMLILIEKVYCSPLHAAQQGIYLAGSDCKKSSTFKSILRQKCNWQILCALAQNTLKCYFFAPAVPASYANFAGGTLRNLRFHFLLPDITASQFAMASSLIRVFQKLGRKPTRSADSVPLATLGGRYPRATRPVILFRSDS